MSETGLRVTKRRATAHALSRTAFELTRERGLDGFTLDELAEKAGVSRRTFANYFSCKEEAVAAVAIEQLREGIATMPDLPESTSLLDWVRSLARHQLSGGMLPLLRELRLLCVRDPALNPYLSDVHTEIRREAQRVVAARAGSGAHQLTAHILVGAAYGALMTLIEGSSVFARHGDGSTLASEETIESDADREVATDEFLDAVFGRLRSGF